MKVKVTSLTEEGLDRREWRDRWQLEINGELKLDFGDGEPEDNNLSRNFNDVFKVPELLQEVYNAGLGKDGFEIENVQVDEI